MITIDNLEIQLDVEGGDDEKEFARLFNDFIRRWAAEAKAKQEADEESKRASSLLEPMGGSDSW